jgi:DNA-binding Lrp family transcriptional regulator
MREFVGIDEVDLAIVHVIEHAPRAPWAVVGSLVGIDASTAARRWERLERTGTAWVTCYPAVLRTQATALVELGCAARSAVSVAAQVARDPRAQFVDVTTGGADILVTVVAENFRALTAYVLAELRAIDGVTSVRTHPVLAVHAEGNLVGAGSLEKVALRQLPTPEHGELASAADVVDELDWELCLALSRDGRASLSSLRRALGASEATVRRRMAKLTRIGALRMMVELATAQTAHPLTVWYAARIGGHALPAAVAAVAAMPNVKAVTSVAGPANLVFKATFADLARINAFEARLAELAPGVSVTDRKVVLRPVRLMSRLLDADGHAREVVSVDIRAGRRRARVPAQQAVSAPSPSTA